MHYHAEVYIKELPEDIEAKLAEIMNPFKETYDETTDKLSGFWNWYSIGGRWNGKHDDGYDPYSDPANVEPCWLCNGTGKRDDDLGREARLQDPSYTCNGCQGTGKKPKFETHFKPNPKDVIPVSQISEKLTCFSFIAPELETVLHKEDYNANHEWVETGFDGNVKKLFDKAHITDGYLVTVDYHC